MKELTQLHNMKDIEPTSTINNAQKKSALVYLMYLNEQRNGTIKDKGFADGRNQYENMDKIEASSATFTIKSVLLTSKTDALENRPMCVTSIHP